MQFLLLFNPDFAPFDPHMVERALRSCVEFTDLRTNDPDGTLVECQYAEPESMTQIRLSSECDAISIRNTWGAALKAALLIQQRLGVPIRMFDDDNGFDLTFSDIQSVEELEAAIDNARRR